MEEQPLCAPKRMSKEDHRDTSESDASTIWILVGLALLMLGGIFYSHTFMDREDGQAGEGIGQNLSELIAGGSGSSAPERQMKEAGLQKAEALPGEKFAGAVTLSSDSGACHSLRNARELVQSKMKQPHSSWQANEYRKDLASIRSRGSELGCWSGGVE